MQQLKRVEFVLYYDILVCAYKPPRALPVRYDSRACFLDFGVYSANATPDPCTRPYLAKVVETTYRALPVEHVGLIQPRGEDLL